MRSQSISAVSCTMSKKAMALLQEGEQSALKNGEKIETKVREFESRVNSVVRVISSFDNVEERIESKLNEKLDNNNTIEKIREEFKKSEQTLSKKLNTIENTIKPSTTLISDVNADIERLKKNIGADFEELKENERALRLKLNCRLENLGADFEDLKANERTLRQKLNEVIVKTQSQHPTRTKYYN